MSECIPSKFVKSHQRCPYFSAELTLLIRRKQRLYKQANQLNSPHSWSKYNKARNRLTSALRSAKRDYLTRLSNNISCPKDFWSAVHKMSPSRQRIPNDVLLLSDSASTPLGKANLFNKFFSSCFGPPSQPFPPAQTFSPPSHGSSIQDITCKEEEVHCLLSSYKLKTASGPDGISSCMLRNTSSSITPALTALFNRSLSLAKIPTDWKTSNVTPIHKSGSRSVVAIELSAHLPAFPHL